MEMLIDSTWLSHGEVRACKPVLSLKQDGSESVHGHVESCYGGPNDSQHYCEYTQRVRPLPSVVDKRESDEESVDSEGE